MGEIPYAGTNPKQLILHSGNSNQYRWVYDMYGQSKCVTFSSNSPSLPIGDTKKSTNTVAGVYASSSAKCVTESYLNGICSLGTYGEGMHGGSGFFTLGENYNSSRLFKGEIFAVRLYGRKLTNAVPCVEPAPNGHRVNLGGYGNTPWATRSQQFSLLWVR